MKSFESQIVDGKLYDSEKSTLLVTLSEWGCQMRCLYRTQKGAYYLAYRSVMADETLTSVTTEAAKEVVALHCSVDTYREIFGEPEEA